MDRLVTLARRTLWMLVVLAAGGAAYAWWRDRDDDALAPPEWPPITPGPSSDDDTAPTTSETTTSGTTGSGTTGYATTESTRPGSGTTGSTRPGSMTPDPAENDPAVSVVNALVDAPEARSVDRAGGGWVDPLDDGSCPLDHPVKANDNSGIFHEPGGRFYDRTRPERCYASPEAATADGYRPARN